MIEPTFRINDYVLLPTGDIGRVIRIDVKESHDTGIHCTTYKVCWPECFVDQPVSWNVRDCESGELGFVDLNASILKTIGFKAVAGQSTCRYQDPVSRKTVVYDRSDASLTVFLNSRHVTIDFMFADYVSDIQHLFSTVGIKFPFLDFHFAHAVLKKRNK